MAKLEEVIAACEKFAQAVDTWTAAREAVRKAKADTVAARAELEALVGKRGK